MAVGTGGTGSQSPHELPDAPEGYQDLTRIDQGGFAVVYRGRQARFDRTVALKILHSATSDEHRLRRFNAECLAIGRVCAHPNIVTVYDAGVTAGQRPWLAMEYCSGGSLADKLARVGPLPVAEVVSIGARLCSALHAAHQAGILHRDVKPHNVLLTSYGEPALADFGIASVVSGDDPGCMATQTAAYTVVHAAPEVLEGRAYTAAADIYSLGSTLYTLLAGQAPFATEASTGLAPLVTRILRNDIPVIARPGVPPELERLLRTCLAAQPGDRPASAAKLGTSLAELGTVLAEPGTSLAEPGNRLGAPVARPLAAGRGETRLEPSLPAAVGSPVGARSLLVIIGGALTVLLTVLTASGFSSRGAGPGQATPSAASRSGGAPPAATSYAPKGFAVAPGQRKGELVVSWKRPTLPDVVATVIYQGPGTARARALVSYDTDPRAAPRATLRGLPGGKQVCVSVAHVVSLDNAITSAASRLACAAPR